MNTEQGTQGARRRSAGDREQVIAQFFTPRTQKNPSSWARPLRQTALVLCLLCPFFLRSSSVLTEKDKDLRKHFGLIFGTAWGPDDQPLYGVKIEIHPVGKKHPRWELFSNHRGEFAQRVPPGPDDYVVTGEVEVVPLVNGVAQKKKKIRGERTVHIDAEERQDIGLHLAE